VLTVCSSVQQCNEIDAASVFNAMLYGALMPCSDCVPLLVMRNLCRG
jgi:hypothetical protein